MRPPIEAVNRNISLMSKIFRAIVVRMDREHPLETWLTAEGISVPEFARAAGLAHNTIYELLRGAGPAFLTVIKVEQATEGAVTIRQMAEYFLEMERVHGSGTLRKRRADDRA